ncbi:hypothetical protein QR46_4898 [Giardia duodenalis assemblage B]|uniref:Uncharacterized protein n=1 Tax=Giardia duodenalis assemblage B TaxID=1394984 RepID=A0A132NM53_GIAIN|nr:hypothetical protein QR46_4898 [Giardia intestinalis assemblage B]
MALSERESHTLAEAPSHGGPDRGDRDARGWGTAAAGFSGARLC